MNIERFTGPIRLAPAAVLGGIALGEAAQLAHMGPNISSLAAFVGGLIGAGLQDAALSYADRHDQQDQFTE